MGLFDSLFGISAQPATQAYNAQQAALTQGKQQANNALYNQSGNEQMAESQAVGGLQPYNATGTSANTMEANALGLNGASGNAAATNAFTSDPGYTYTLNQGLQSVLRNSAATGNVASGNTLEGLDTFGTNLANQEYQSWLGNLSGLGAQGLTAAGGQANALNNLSNLFGQTGGQLANVDTGTGTQLSNAAGQYGTNITAMNAAGGADLTSLLSGLLSAGAKAAPTLATVV